jgi:hypothetical protein
VAKLELEAGGAVKHCSDTGHYCSALFREGILFFLGAFAPPQRERGFATDRGGARRGADVRYELLQFQWVWPQPQPAT